MTPGWYPVHKMGGILRIRNVIRVIEQNVYFFDSEPPKFSRQTTSPFVTHRLMVWEEGRNVVRRKV